MTRSQAGFTAAALALSLAAAPAWACFQEDCSKGFGAPPQLLRPPIGAQVLEPDALGWGLHWGVNDRSSIAGQNEGSTWFRASLGDSGIETLYGFGAPQFIPYIDIRAQLLGYGWQHGPYVTLELGGDLLPSRHIGLAVGGKLGPVSPFVAASVGHSLDKDMLEGSAGVVIELRDQLSINAAVSRRLNLADQGDILANTATVALDWHLKPGTKAPKASKRRRGRNDDAEIEAGDGKAWPEPPAEAAKASREKNAATAAAADAAADPQDQAGLATGAPSAAPTPVAGADPCGFSATIDAFDPTRWEARARCLDALGKPDEARAARAKAKELKDKDKADR